MSWAGSVRLSFLCAAGFIPAPFPWIPAPVSNFLPNLPGPSGSPFSSVNGFCLGGQLFDLLLTYLHSRKSTSYPLSASSRV
ncbi:hypothetical protein B0T18DRAFT_405131 [Schizothecium vesticola]|uniref:Secreted protein n=1 Tax=Schizothecium vesticola TaxID=314040 RepID=A0AA40F7E8_9PEZI|nr:hypothetical protein B0T18DRAFT_405131 [Schizothecium vesticola]